MTKAELIERIVDALIDPWTDNPEDYLYDTPIDIDGAKDFYNQIRSDEDDADLEPDERMPEEATPELVMEAYNCLIRARKHEAWIDRMEEFIIENDCVCEYANYYVPAHKDALDLIPVEFVTESNDFPFTMADGRKPDTVDTFLIGMRSARTFNPNHEFCWFDQAQEVLHSTDEPFRNGVLDAHAFAEFAIDDKETFDYFVDCIMTDDEIREVFGCTKEELTNG